MKNTKLQKSSAFPTKPAMNTEKNALSTSVWIWIGLIVMVCCVPLLNWVAVPFIAGLGILGFALYSFFKIRNSRNSTPADERFDEYDSGFETRSAGLKTTKRSTDSDRLQKQG